MRDNYHEWQYCLWMTEGVCLFGVQGTSAVLYRDLQVVLMLCLELMKYSVCQSSRLFVLGKAWQNPCLLIYIMQSHDLQECKYVYGVPGSIYYR